MMDAVREDVKFNCDVSDAKYWGFFSVCGLLMRLRDLFRSESNLRPWSTIEKEKISSWIAAKESAWPALEKEEFRDLSIGGRTFDPFDVSGINTALNEEGLVYGAGYGLHKKPAFFLADLHSMRRLYDLTVYTGTREHVRDLFASPAMLQGRCVFLRLETLEEHLWETFLEVRGKKDVYPRDVFSDYGISLDESVDERVFRRLDDVTSRYSRILQYHELGESVEDIPGWHDILAAVSDRTTEYFLRALKDLIADTSDYGPLRRIIQTHDKGALALFVSSQEGFRKTLYPELRTVLDAFFVDGDWVAVDTVRRQGYERFTAKSREIVGLYEGRGLRETVDDAIGAFVRATTGLRS